MTAERYPTCIKCNKEKHQEFDIGWEEIIDNSDCVNNPEGSARTFYLCPDCISEFEHYKQLKAEQAPLIESHTKVMSLFNELGNLINKAKEEDLKQ